MILQYLSIAVPVFILNIFDQAVLDIIHLSFFFILFMIVAEYVKDTVYDKKDYLQPKIPGTFLLFGIFAILLNLTGLDFITSMSAAGTAISNVGPGIGDTIGPSSTFQELNDTAKWILSAAMLVGRLELFTVLVLFVPRFWRT